MTGPSELSIEPNTTSQRHPLFTIATTFINAVSSANSNKAYPYEFMKTFASSLQHHEKLQFTTACILREYHTTSSGSLTDENPSPSQILRRHATPAKTILSEIMQTSHFMGTPDNIIKIGRDYNQGKDIPKLFPLVENIPKDIKEIFIEAYIEHTHGKSGENLEKAQREFCGNFIFGACGTRMSDASNQKYLETGEVLKDMLNLNKIFGEREVKEALSKIVIEQFEEYKSSYKPAPPISQNRLNELSSIATLSLNTARNIAEKITIDFDDLKSSLETLPLPSQPENLRKAAKDYRDAVVEFMDIHKAMGARNIDVDKLQKVVRDKQYAYENELNKFKKTAQPAPTQNPNQIFNQSIIDELNNQARALASKGILTPNDEAQIITLLELKRSCEAKIKGDPHQTKVLDFKEIFDTTFPTGKFSNTIELSKPKSLISELIQKSEKVKNDSSHLKKVALYFAHQLPANFQVINNQLDNFKKEHNSVRAQPNQTQINSTFQAVVSAEAKRANFKIGLNKSKNVPSSSESSPPSSPGWERSIQSAPSKPRNQDARKVGKSRPTPITLGLKAKISEERQQRVEPKPKPDTDTPIPQRPNGPKKN